MTQTLFSQWTDHQLQTAFALANAELAARKKKRRKDMAAILKTRAANRPASNTPR